MFGKKLSEIRCEMKGRPGDGRVEDSMMEEAMETAAMCLNKKLEKAHMKHRLSLTAGGGGGDSRITNGQHHHNHPKDGDHQGEHQHADMEVCSSCQKQRAELEGGRRASIVRSSAPSSRFQRRIGVSERNPMESRLVRETMKIVTVNESIEGWAVSSDP